MTTRRNFIAGLPALPTIAGLPLASHAAQPESEVLRRFRAILVERARQYAKGRYVTDAEMDALADTETAMVDVPSTSAADMAAKYVVESCYGNDGMSPKLFEESLATLEAAGVSDVRSAIETPPRTPY